VALPLRDKRRHPMPYSALFDTVQSASRLSTTVAVSGRLITAGIIGDFMWMVTGDRSLFRQAITELALEICAPVTISEFHALNPLLDAAIADAVSQPDETAVIQRGRSTVSQLS
jgi:hypothetical protein